MNIDFWNKIYYNQYHKTRFKKRRKTSKSLYDIIYKSWPIPLCKCHDCKQARKLPSKIKYRKYYNRNYLFGYPKVKELEPSTVIRFYEMFKDSCPYKADIFDIIHKHSAKWCWVNDNYYISIYIMPPIDFKLSKELNTFIDNVNATDYYYKYRLEWSICPNTSVDPNEYAITLHSS